MNVLKKSLFFYSVVAPGFTPMEYGIHIVAPSISPSLFRYGFYFYYKYRFFSIFYLFIFFNYNVKHYTILKIFVQILYLIMGKKTTVSNSKNAEVKRTRDPLTAKEKLDICKLHAEKKSFAEIGRLFNRNRSTIQTVVQNQEKFRLPKKCWILKFYNYYKKERQNFRFHGKFAALMD